MKFPTRFKKPKKRSIATLPVVKETIQVQQKIGKTVSPQHPNIGFVIIALILFLVGTYIGVFSHFEKEYTISYTIQRGTNWLDWTSYNIVQPEITSVETINVPFSIIEFPKFDWWGELTGEKALVIITAEENGKDIAQVRRGIKQGWKQSESFEDKLRVPVDSNPRIRIEIVVEGNIVTTKYIN